MDPTTTSPSTMARTFTKILRLRRASTFSGHGGMESSKDDSTHKLKFSKSLEGYSSVLSEPHYGKGKEEQQQQEKLNNDRETMESLLANQFARISAIKAAYAQLQFAQSPYDPDSIQSADQTVVSELRTLSELKYFYINNQLDIHTLIDSKSPLEAQVQEQRNLLKTYKISIRKLETDLDFKDSKILSLQAELLELDSQNKSLKAMLQPGRCCSLSRLDDLHLSGLNPNHLLTVLQYAVKSIRSFVKLMVQEMEAARWDLDAAAGAIHPDVVLWKPEHRIFAFESYICQTMFSEFHHRDFNLSSLEHRANWNQQLFFDEFVKLKSLKTKQVLDRKVASASGLQNFCRAKYLSLVHQTMEVVFFGSLNYRSLVSSGRGFPDSEFFMVFAEMARRVWLLHCLFFSFGTEMEASIFQVRKGGRLSDMYMENVVVDDPGVSPTAGFTVVPGFKLGKMVIQSKVYPLLREVGEDGHTEQGLPFA